MFPDRFGSEGCRSKTTINDQDLIAGRQSKASGYVIEEQRFVSERILTVILVFSATVKQSA